MSMRIARSPFIAASASLCAVACVGCGGSPPKNGTLSHGGADGSAEAEATESGSGNASEASYDAISLRDPSDAAVDAWHCLKLYEDCTSRPADCCQTPAPFTCYQSGTGAVCGEPGLQ
jgi:hypothetical protein